MVVARGAGLVLGIEGVVEDGENTCSCFYSFPNAKCFKCFYKCQMPPTVVFSQLSKGWAYPGPDKADKDKIIKFI